jgi:hypothetical protein
MKKQEYTHTIKPLKGHLPDDINNLIYRFVMLEDLETRVLHYYGVPELFSTEDPNALLIEASKHVKGNLAKLAIEMGATNFTEALYTQFNKRGLLMNPNIIQFLIQEGRITVDGVVAYFFSIPNHPNYVKFLHTTLDILDIINPDDYQENVNTLNEEASFRGNNSLVDLLIEGFGADIKSAIRGAVRRCQVSSSEECRDLHNFLIRYSYFLPQNVLILVDDTAPIVIRTKGFANLLLETINSDYTDNDDTITGFGWMIG